MADPNSNSDLMSTPIVWTQLHDTGAGNRLSPSLMSSQSNASGNNMIANSNLEPIAFIELVPTPAINLTLRSKRTATALIETTGDTEAFIDKNSNAVILENGEILISATANTMVKANGHTVTLPGGTVATLSLHSDILRIKNLYEKKSRSTRVACGKIQRSLASGEELIVTRSILASKVASSDTIGRRRAERKDLDGNCFISSEYSFITAVKNSNVLKLVMKGSDKDNRLLTDRMKKMAVCLNQVTSGHGSFGPLK
jgi:hypothetical protein